MGWRLLGRVMERTFGKHVVTENMDRKRNRLTSIWTYKVTGGRLIGESVVREGGIDRFGSFQ